MTQKDFFISYNGADRTWAEWIAWELEEAGYQVIIQAWDFRPGSDFVLEMQRATSEAKRTIGVLSENFLNALYTQPEWAAAFKQDPTGDKGILVFVRVAPCTLKGMLATRIYIDLVAQEEAEARQKLLAGLRRERAKPTEAPGFPGVAKASVHTVAKPEAFPGSVSQSILAGANLSGTVTIGSITQIIQGSPTTMQNPTTPEPVHLLDTLKELPPPLFDEVVYRLRVPSSILSGSNTPQTTRAIELLRWTEGPGGSGLARLAEVIEAVLKK